MIAALLLMLAAQAPAQGRMQIPAQADAVPTTRRSAAPVTSASSAPTANRFSILVDPCARAGVTPVGNDVVVCGKGADTRRLPLPDERMPTGPVPSNPDLTGRGALAASSTPCITLQQGCTVGFGGPVVAAAVNGIVTAVSDGIADRKVRAARRRDAGRRIPIPLDDPAPSR